MPTPNATATAEPAEPMSMKEILQERAQIVRLYEASCGIAHPNDEDLRFRAGLMRKLGKSFNLAEGRPTGTAPAPTGKPATTKR